MRSGQTRREFLSDVGRGVLVAGVSFDEVTDLGLGAAWGRGWAGGGCSPSAPPSRSSP